MFQSKNPDYKNYVQLKLERNQFGKTLGFRLDEINEGSVVGIMPVQSLHEQQNGFVHGGVISTLHDMACGFAAYSLVPEGVQVFTAELNVRYLRKGIGDSIIAKGRVVKPGKRMMFCESEVFVVNNGEEILISKGSSVMAVVDDYVPDKYGGK